MRIAIVNDIASVGSVQAAALRAAGLEADLIEPARPGARIPYPWKAVTLPLRLAGLLAAAARIRAGHYDLAHVHYARLGMVGPLAGLPYVLHCHGSDIRGVRPGSPWGLEIAPFLRRASLVYYATPDLGPWVRAFRSDAVFLPNPIDTASFRPNGGQPDRDVLVGVRLDPIKGLDTIVELLGRLAGARPGTSVTIVDQGAGVARAVMAAGSDRLVVPRATREALPGLFRRHRLAIGQFQVGAIGNYELEAMACGLPVIADFRLAGAYDVAPPVAVATDAVTGAALAAELLEDDARRAEIAAAGVAWVEETHAAAAIARRLVAAYQSISPPGLRGRQPDPGRPPRP